MSSSGRRNVTSWFESGEVTGGGESGESGGEVAPTVFATMDIKFSFTDRGSTTGITVVNLAGGFHRRPAADHFSIDVRVFDF